MPDALKSMLKRAEADCLRIWLARHNAATIVIPEAIAERAGFAEIVVVNLRQNSPESHAALERDANRVTEVGDPTRDWVMRRVLDDPGGSIDPGFHTRSPEGRALWLFLHARERFEAAEELCAIYHHVDRKRTWTRFSCAPMTDLRPDPDVPAGFKDALAAIFGLLDGSGRNLDFEVDVQRSRDDIRSLIITAKIERPLAIREEFIGGHVADRPAHDATYARFLFEPSTGRLDVVTTRGKGDVRVDAAEAFAEHVLGQENAPRIWQVPEIDLRFAWGGRLPTREEDAIDKVTVGALLARRNDYPSLLVRMEEKKHSMWDAVALLAGASPQDPGPWEVVSAEFTAKFQRGLGPNGKKSKSITFRADAKGGTTLEAANERHRLFRDHYLPWWEEQWKSEHAKLL